MTKADLINYVAADLGENPAHIRRVVETFIDEMRNSLIRGERIDLRRFGNFIPVVKKATFGRLIKEDKMVAIPEKKYPKFKPSKEYLLNEMNEQVDQGKTFEF